ncbi:MAG: hypothetical protein CMJ78_15665 [Planctomycetaceae bacterium]|nr:hypothetical protein [Planctomycetaceae bacterium]
MNGERDHGGVSTDEETTFPQQIDTFNNIDLSDFLRRERTTRIVGVVTPIVSSVDQPIFIESFGCEIGRDKSAGFHISDNSVSRQHARIRRTSSDEFIIEDLGSSNGTYIDGVPIRSCMLWSGDPIQLGQNLFVFERVRQFIDEEGDNQ